MRSQILTHWEAQDEPEHLRTIRNRLLLNATNPRELLRLYQRILKRGGVAIKPTREHIELRFSGLVTQRQGQLQVFNRIYEAVFDQAWITQQLQGLPPTPNRQSQPQSLNRRPFWQSSLLSLGVTPVVIALQFLGWLQPLELRVFDQFMRWRPAEPADERFLIITVEEADIQYQDRMGYQRTGGSLADTALADVLQKIAPLSTSCGGCGPLL